MYAHVSVIVCVYLCSVDMCCVFEGVCEFVSTYVHVLVGGCGCGCGYVDGCL